VHDWQLFLHPRLMHVNGQTKVSHQPFRLGCFQHKNIKISNANKRLNLKGDKITNHMMIKISLRSLQCRYKTKLEAWIHNVTIYLRLYTTQATLSAIQCLITKEDHWSNYLYPNSMIENPHWQDGKCHWSCHGKQAAVLH